MTFHLAEQESEENFDLALIAALEIDVVPHIGDARVPDDVISQLGKMLQKGSRVYEDGVSSSASSATEGSFEKLDMERAYGSTDLGTLVPRERFSFWCFDLLFLVCSDTTKGTVYYYFYHPAMTLLLLFGDRSRTFAKTTGSTQYSLFVESMSIDNGRICGR